MGILDIIFPKRCVGCGRVGKYFCNECKKTIHIISETEAICPMCGRRALDGKTHPSCRTIFAIDGLTSFFHYSGVVRKGIKAIKYRLISDMSSAFVDLVSIEMTHNIKQEGSGFVLVPIPLHNSRLRQRGFNQAMVLGAIICQRLGISMATDVLVRKRHTLPQVEMKDRDKRLKNMANVFAIVKPPPESVYLFDDVFTTGATMRSATGALKRAGAKSVWAVTMAR